MKWIKEPPELVGGKSIKRFVKTDKGGKCAAYYFPYHFKTVEWEDWDDYKPEYFPHTENDNEKGCVWLNPGWYEETGCDRCDEHYYKPVTVVEWLNETPPPEKPSVLDFTGHLDITAEECNAAPLLCRYARALENYIKENITT